MIYQKLRKIGDTYVVTIPEEEIERQGLEEGQVLVVEVRRAEESDILPDDLRQAFEESWNRNQDGYRYLAGR